MVEDKLIFLVADDHAVVRRGLTLFLKDIYPNSIVHQASSFLEVLQLLSKEKIDLLMLDVNFPEGTSLGLIPSVRKIQTNIKILILSAFDEDIYAIRYLNAGANGYLNKLSAETEMKEAINSIFTDGRYVSQTIQNKILNSYILKKPLNPFEELSNREIEIVKLMVEGESNHEIGKVFNINKTTVSTYRHRIFQKLGVKSLSSLMDLFNFYYNTKG